MKGGRGLKGRALERRHGKPECETKDPLRSDGSTTATPVVDFLTNRWLAVQHSLAADVDRQLRIEMALGNRTVALTGLLAGSDSSATAVQLERDSDLAKPSVVRALVRRRRLGLMSWSSPTPVVGGPQGRDEDVTLSPVRPITSVEDERLDRALLAAARTDPEAFAEFYRRHVDRIVAFSTARVRSPDEVADLVASTFLVALDRAGNYDPDRGEAIRWLYGIASRLLANQRRRRVRESLANARFDARSLLEESDIERLESQIQAASTASLVHRAMQELPQRQREILLLVGADELGSSAGGAEILRITPIAFRVRLARARRALRAALERSSSRSANDSPRGNQLTLEEIVP